MKAVREEQGKLRRALAVVFAWLQAMEYTSFDYTLDRIERLEREVGQLKEELRQGRDVGRTAADESSYILVSQHATVQPIGNVESIPL